MFDLNDAVKVFEQSRSMDVNQSFLESRAVLRDLSGLPIALESTVIQILQSAMDVTKSGLMFPTVDHAEQLTPVETVFIHKILKDVLTTHMIFTGAEGFIANVLLYYIDQLPDIQEIRCQPALTNEKIYEAFTEKTGVYMNEEVHVQLTWFAHALAVSNRIFATRDIREAGALQQCFNMVQNMIDLHDQGETNYGQQNIGIVVAGVYFEVPSNNPLLSMLCNDLMCLEELKKADSGTCLRRDDDE